MTGQLKVWDGTTWQPSGAPLSPIPVQTGAPASPVAGQLWYDSDEVAVGAIDSIPKALVDAKGDLLAGSANDTVVRKAVGSDEQVLTALAANADGLSWATPTNRVPDEVTLYNGGNATYTLTPLTAGTVEPGNPPLVRSVVDLAKATQMRIIHGRRAVAVGGTSCDVRIQYATNGATQTTWADIQNTGTGISQYGGSANLVQSSGWIDLVSGAKINDCYIRMVYVIVGTVTTAPIMIMSKVQFR